MSIVKVCISEAAYRSRRRSSVGNPLSTWSWDNRGCRLDGRLRTNVVHTHRGCVGFPGRLSARSRWNRSRRLSRLPARSSRLHDDWTLQRKGGRPFNVFSDWASAPWTAIALRRLVSKRDKCRHRGSIQGGCFRLSRENTLH